MGWRTKSYWYIGLAFCGLAALSAVAIILSAVGLSFLSGVWWLRTYPLADTESEIWALLLACAVAGLALTAFAAAEARAAAALTSPPAAGPGAADVVWGAAEVGLLAIGLLCALLIFLCGIRLLWLVEVRSTYDLWAMLVAFTGLGIFSAAKGRGIREWFSAARRAERERQSAAYYNG